MLNSTPNFEKLVQDNMGILLNHSRYFAKHNPGQLADVEDYFQQACIILMDNYTKYDPTKGSWANYLNHIIFKELSNYSTQVTSNLTVSKKAVKLAYQIFKLEKHGHSPDEIVQILGVSRKRYLEVKNVLTRGDLSNIIIGDDNHLRWQEFLTMRENLESEEEKEVFDLFVRGFTNRQIGINLGHGVEWARQRVLGLIVQLRELDNVA